MAYYSSEFRRGGPYWQYDEDYDLEFGGRGYGEWRRQARRAGERYPYPYPGRRPRFRDYATQRDYNARFGYERPAPGYGRRGGRGYSRYGSARGRPGEIGSYDYDFPGPERVPYGHSAVDRWPESGHDLDHPLPGEERMSDEEIRRAVLENLFDDTWIDPNDIDVSVDDGIVTLRGEVADFMEARYAWDDAWETMGVRGVINHLTVRTDLPGPEMAMPQTASGRTRRERR